MSLRASRLCLGIVVAMVGACASSRAEPRRELDWCAAIVASPDQRWKDPRACVPFYSEAELAESADVLLVGEFTDVSTPVIPSPGRACEKEPGHGPTAEWVGSLRAARQAAGKPPATFVHQHRFDLVPATLAAQPGFEASFLVKADRSRAEVQAFFSKDASGACSGGCRFSDSWPNLEGKDAGRRLRDYIDAKGGAGAHERVVYYMARPQAGSDVFGVTAAVADLGNPAYRAWRVKEAKAALAAGGYDVIALNHKFHQYRAGSQHWIGGPEAHNVAALRSTGDTFFTAPPKNYGYPEYVAGWSALGRELREAGVPYSVTLNAANFTGNGFDDRSSPANEAELIRKTAEGAALVLIDRSGGSPPQAVLDDVVRRLEARGPRVVVFDQRCGISR